ncbi:MULTISPECIES: hypothetical protein [unclassified Streptomyces]|uniref:hypothetical protein n=1 Tax=unclassified Streptomyces TaxID=2593676 RepID=UPI0037FC1CD2
MSSAELAAQDSQPRRWESELLVRNRISSKLYITSFAALAVLGFGYVSVFGVHAPSWAGAGESCTRSGRAEAAGTAHDWGVVLPGEASDVFRCTEGTGGRTAGQARFVFAMPAYRVPEYFDSMGIEPLPRFDIRDLFDDFSRSAGRDTKDIQKYQAGTVSKGHFTLSVLIDEGNSDSVAVYVHSVSSG